MGAVDAQNPGGLHNPRVLGIPAGRAANFGIVFFGLLRHHVHKLITPASQVNRKSNYFVMVLDRIEKLRVRLGLTKAEVYEKLEISQPMISMMRAGKRQLSVKAMRRLEAAEIEAGLSDALPPGRSRDRPGKQGDSGDFGKNMADPEGADKADIEAVIKMLNDLTKTVAAHGEILKALSESLPQQIASTEAATAKQTRRLNKLVKDTDPPVT